MKKLFFISICFLQISTCLFAFTPTGDENSSKKKNKAPIQYGIASYYSDRFQNKKTASGEMFDQQKMTAAHNSLPLNTWIRVTNLRNKKSVIVRINDRLHPRNTRLVDLSHTAASKLGYLKVGLTRVKVEVLGKKKPAEVSEEEI